MEVFSSETDREKKNLFKHECLAFFRGFFFNIFFKSVAALRCSCRRSVGPLLQTVRYIYHKL